MKAVKIFFSKFVKAPDEYPVKYYKKDKQYPKNSFVNTFHNQVSEISRVEIGAVAPEISMRNPIGKTINLSDLKGKVVLIDFWASWCGPCRGENPNVVKAYNKYKSKGFEIFSVSLDQDVNKWKAAIQKDNLSWVNHVNFLQECFLLYLSAHCKVFR